MYSCDADVSEGLFKSQRNQQLAYKREVQLLVVNREIRVQSQPCLDLKWSESG